MDPRLKIPVLQSGSQSELCQGGDLSLFQSKNRLLVTLDLKFFPLR